MVTCPLPPPPTAQLQLKVRDFAPEAQFVDPCRSLVLADVACVSCRHMENLDLNRHNLPADEERNWRWACRQCRHPYDAQRIEELLVCLAHRRSLAYQLQDARCPKCRSLRKGHLSPTCSQCGTRFGNTVSAKSLRELLLTLDGIASWHELTYLQEVADWLLRT